MNWLTEKEVLANSGTLICALKCSRDHHHQLATCTQKEIQQLPYLLGCYIRSDFCALCIRRKRLREVGRGCAGVCPLFDAERMFCCEEWWKVNEAIKAYLNKKSNVRFGAFRDAERALVARIDRAITKHGYGGRLIC